MTIPSVTVNAGEHSVSLSERLKVDRNNLTQELSEQPALFAYFASLEQDARDRYNRTKLDLELYEAQQDVKIRYVMTQQRPAGQWIMDKEVDRRIKIDPRWLQLYEAFLDASKDWGMLQAARQAFEQRKDVLVTLTHQARIESAQSYSSLHQPSLPG